MRTRPHTLNDKTTWTKVAEDAANVLIQLRSTITIQVWCGPNADTPAESDPGIVLWEDGRQEFGAANLEAGTSFWVKPSEDGEAFVVVMEDGIDLEA
tara:strand:- start:1582 stop:1872 length:291 start_codon:yes stop_codon:yes gene_type:complete